jgi:hypothetical protein
VFSAGGRFFSLFASGACARARGQPGEGFTGRARVKPCSCALRSIRVRARGRRAGRAITSMPRVCHSALEGSSKPDGRHRQRCQRGDFSRSKKSDAHAKPASVFIRRATLSLGTFAIASPFSWPPNQSLSQFPAHGSLRTGVFTALFTGSPGTGFSRWSLTWSLGTREQKPDSQGRPVASNARGRALVTSVFRDRRQDRSPGLGEEPWISPIFVVSPSHNPLPC